MDTIKYDLFKLEDPAPMKMYLYKLGNLGPIVSPALELIYVLEGNVEIVSGDRFFILKEDDIFLNNSYQSHELRSEGAVILNCEIDMEKLGVGESERNSVVFDCNSSVSLDKSPYVKIKSLIASFVGYNLKYQEIKTYANLSIVYSLFAEFMNKYRVISNVSIQQTSKYVKRLREIVKYINDNYQNCISLKQISSHLGFTVPYLSSFFEKYMSKNFQDYYDEFRISKSMTYLISSDKTIELIAQTNGFSDLRAYVRAFKKIYSISPTEYRKKILVKQKENYSDYYQNFDKQKYLDKLLNGFDKSYSLPIKKHKNSILQEVRCDFLSEGTELKKTYMNILCIDKASDLLKTSIREMAFDAQKTMHFTFVQFHGIFEDCLQVISKSNDGYRYSFIYVDEIFDFILSLGLKPFVEFSYMPSLLSSDPTRIYGTMNYSSPSSVCEYVNLCVALTKHLIIKYGEQVKSWPFTIWSGPDTTEYAFGFKNVSDFFELYQKTYQAVKEIEPTILFGTPSLVPLCKEIKAWDARFLTLAKANNVYPDFLKLNFFSSDFSTFFNHEVGMERLSENPQLMTEYIDYIKSKDFYEGNKIYISEFHFTIFQRNLLSDTIFDSCYIVKNLLDNINTVDGIGKWHLTDLTNESQIPNKLFHGGTGLYTYNGIKKPCFYAYQFLSKLGSTILSRGNGYILTKEKNKMIILFYNYEHYSPLYARGDYFKLSEHDRYSPFESNKVVQYELHIDNIQYQHCVVKTTTLSRESGSAYDLTERMGLNDSPSKDEIQVVKNLSTPSFKIENLSIDHCKINLNFRIDTLEVKLVEIEFN